ncbi:hypothetical protein [Dyadobacter sandarakinus]|uniref:Fibronectin type-III domain-containing protein n=1 Tax=Dyadobacter sandarakinus TaxID=2747268 RepID=A0ABX7IB27_9BACT|nr:hypothetical protein [Dyadobacter sandarakinus]QRR03010.1 hypothetical protein HWI92_19895 [Dyadobacter sandarakinus]
MQKLVSFLVLALVPVMQACDLFGPVDALSPVTSEVLVLQVIATGANVSGHIADPAAGNSRQEKKSGQIVDYGFVYGTKIDPVIENDKTQRVGVDIPESSRIFDAWISGLSVNTTYYIRVYARNEGGGIAYGPSVSIVTGNYVLPLLTTNQITGITANAAVVNFTIVNTGTVPILAYGVCYSNENQLPTPYNSKLQVDGAVRTGSFKLNLDKLSDGTTYFVRPYVITGGGISYGRVVTFTAGQPAILKDTTFVMNYSNTYDLETGEIQMRNGMEDLYWYPYGQPAGIYPKNGAKYAVLPDGTDFNKLRYSDLLSQNYSGNFVDGSYTAKTNKLKNGTVVAYITNVGHYGKMRINSKGTDRTDTDVYSGNMEVSVVTYNND